MQEGSGLTWDTGALKGCVTSYIDDASKKLKSASATISSLPTPEGCEAARNLYEMVDNIKKSVEEVKTDVQDAANSLEQNENNIQDFIGSLSDKFKDFFNLPQENKDTEINTDEEKLKDPLSENNPFTSIEAKTRTRTTRTTTRTKITRTRTTSQPVNKDVTSIKPKWDSDYLTAPKGYIKYKGKDGRLTKETWCDLKTTQLVINMHERRN